MLDLHICLTDFSDPPAKVCTRYKLQVINRPTYRGHFSLVSFQNVNSLECEGVVNMYRVLHRGKKKMTSMTKETIPALSNWKLMK
jgi:hypothetical protein